MKFSQLCDYLKRLETTDSRNEMTIILAELLKDTTEDEAEIVVNMILGQLRPSYEDVEFSLAEKQVIKAIAMRFDKSDAEVLSLFKSKGDLGKVVSEIGESNDTGLSVSEVFERLVKIARESGSGSQERKLMGVADLLVLLGNEESKYVVRIILSRLRLGFSDKTLIDALSFYLRGDKSLSKRVERVYQAAPDIGFLTKRIFVEGEKAVDKLVLKVGVPVMPMLCQRLKSPKEMIKKMGEVAVEAKFDGTRVQIHFDGHEVKTYTRNLEETSHMFPELSAMKEVFGDKKVILDAEAVGFDPKTQKILSFQATITRKRKHGIEDAAKTVPLKFFIFDVLFYDQEVLIEKNYEERRKKLNEIIPKNEVLVVDEFTRTTDPQVIVDLHRKYLDEGLEGVIVKKLDSLYVPGRTGWSWVKMKEVESAAAKLADTIDVVVMGYYRGKGKRTKFGLGAFLVGVRDGERILTLAKIGTGLSDEQFIEINRRLEKIASVESPENYVVNKSLVPDVYVDPEIVVEVAADEITQSPVHSAGVALRFPRLIKFRDDKNLSGVTTVEELSNIRQG